MFSNLASYIFGAAAESDEPEVPVPGPEEVKQAPVPESVPERIPERAEEAERMDDEDWELVGEDAPALTLGSLGDMITRPALGSTGSSDPSLDSEDSGDAPGPARDPEGSALTRTARRLTVPFGSLAGTTSLAEVRGVRTAQTLKVKDSTRQLTAKALDRRNKAVKHHHAGHSARKTKVPTMALKAAGSSRHLKQC